MAWTASPWRLSLCPLLLVLSATAQAQFTDAELTNLPSSFHDEALNATYFYPPHFTPEPLGTANPVNCLHTTLTAWSHIASGLSSFAVSKMDATCPQGLPGVTSLGGFVRRQLLADLQPQGDAKIIHEPLRYFIDGHTAMVTLATVTVAKPAKKTAGITYAAKACALDDAGGKRKRKPDSAAPVSRVLCFDFTTQNSDLLDMMFSFIIQFGDHAPEALFPITVRPRY